MNPAASKDRDHRRAQAERLVFCQTMVDWIFSFRTQSTLLCPLESGRRRYPKRLDRPTNFLIECTDLNRPNNLKNNPGKSAPLIGIIAAFVVIYLVWGSTYLAIRFAVETIQPFLMASLRFLVAGSIMYGWLWARGEAKVTKREALSCAISGTLMLVGGNGLVCWAEQFVPSGITALIIGTAPLWIVMVGWIGFQDGAPSGKIIAGLLLGLVGVVMLANPTGISGEESNPFGMIAILFACFFWAWGSFLSKSPTMPKSTLLSVAIQMLFAGAVMLMVSFVLGEPMKMDWLAVSAKSFWSLAYLIFFGAILAYTCYGWLFRNASAVAVSTYAYVNPVVAVILGYYFAREPITQATIIGATLILLGVLLVSGRKKTKPDAEAVVNTANNARGEIGHTS